MFGDQCTLLLFLMSVWYIDVFTFYWVSCQKMNDGARDESWTFWFRSTMTPYVQPSNQVTSASSKLVALKDTLISTQTVDSPLVNRWYEEENALRPEQAVLPPQSTQTPTGYWTRRARAESGWLPCSPHYHRFPLLPLRIQRSRSVGP